MLQSAAFYRTRGEAVSVFEIAVKIGVASQRTLRRLPEQSAAYWLGIVTVTELDKPLSSAPEPADFTA
jgi:hypothetical protein